MTENGLKWQENGVNRSSERGSALVVMLILVGVIAAILTVMMSAQSRVERDRKARAAGWYLAQVSKAARIFVRDQSLNPGDPYHVTNLAVAAGGAPQEIAVADLVAAGYLPAGFGGTNPNTTPLGQMVSILAGAHPHDGDPATDYVVSVAYVYAQPNGNIRGRQAQFMAVEARKNDVVVMAPVYGGGVNLTAPCRPSGPAPVAIWDTGCLEENDFENNINASGTAFAEGGLLIPTWRAAQHDTRAIMRFAQPENPGFSTMVTDVHMGTPNSALDDCSDNRQTYNDASGTAVDSLVCNYMADNPGGGAPEDRDLRFDILNTGNLDQINEIIIADQGTDITYDYETNPAAPAETAYFAGFETNGRALDIDGNANVGGNMHMSGSMAKINAADPYLNFTGASAGAPVLSIGTDVVVSNNAADPLNGSSMSVGGGISGGQAIAEQVGVFTRGGADMAGLQNVLTTIGELNTLVSSGAAAATVQTKLTEVRGLLDALGGGGTATINTLVANDFAMDSLSVSDAMGGGGPLNGVVTKMLNAAGTTVNTVNADILGVISVDTVDVTGTGPELNSFNTLAADIVSSGAPVNLAVNGPAQIDDSSMLDGNVTVNNIYVEECYGDCPDITPECEPPLGLEPWEPNPCLNP